MAWLSYCQDNIKGLRPLSAHVVGPELETSVEPVSGHQLSSIEDSIVFERLLDITKPVLSAAPTVPQKRSIHIVSRVFGQQPLRDLARMLDQALVVGLAEYEDILDMQLQADLRQLLGELSDAKRHVRQLLLGQKTRVLGLVGVRCRRILVYAAFLGQAFVRLRVVLYGQALVFFEKRVDNAGGGAALVFWARRHLGGGIGSERGLAAVAVVSAFENNL